MLKCKQQDNAWKACAKKCLFVFKFLKIYCEPGVNWRVCFAFQKSYFWNFKVQESKSNSKKNHVSNVCRYK